MTKDTGGPAFPHVHSHDVAFGMTLRDWFAGQALMGILAHDSAVSRELLKMFGKEGLTRADVAAVAAGLYADAMIAERSKP